MTEPSKQPPVDFSDIGLCLQQAFFWIEKCHAIGARQFRAEDQDAAGRVDLALENEVGTLSARLDLTGRTVEFALLLDDGPAGAREIALFSQAFAPGEPLQ